MKRHLHPARRSAFTLIEMVVAMTILGAGILGVVATFSLSTRAGGAALRQAEAAQVAQNRMELAVLAKSDALAADRGEENGYRWTVTYESQELDLVLAIVTVEWEEGQGTQSFVLRRLFLPSQPRNAS